MELSIITTLYKSEPYIRKCLDSLLKQNLTTDEYEIVVVDDGSPDNCVEIIENEYIPHHNNIRVIRQKNKGLPEARNTGLIYSSGEYITFVDPDDFVEPYKYDNLLKEIKEQQLDAIRFGFNLIDEKTYQLLPMFKENMAVTQYDSEIVDGETFLGRKLGFACYVWQFIFKKELFINNNISFREKVFDDADLLPRLLLHVNRISSLDTQVYNYVQRGGSLVNVLDQVAARKKITGYFFLIEQYNSLYSQYSNQYARKWLRTMVNSSFCGILDTATLYDNSNTNTYISLFRQVNKLVLSTYNRRIKKKIKLIIAAYMPHIYCCIFPKHS